MPNESVDGCRTDGRTDGRTDDSQQLRPSPDTSFAHKVLLSSSSFVLCLLPHQKTPEPTDPQERIGTPTRHRTEKEGREMFRAALVTRATLGLGPRCSYFPLQTLPPRRNWASSPALSMQSTFHPLPSRNWSSAALDTASRSSTSHQAAFHRDKQFLMSALQSQHSPNPRALVVALETISRDPGAVKAVLDASAQSRHHQAFLQTGLRISPDSFQDPESASLLLDTSYAHLMDGGFTRTVSGAAIALDCLVLLRAIILTLPARSTVDRPLRFSSWRASSRKATSSAAPMSFGRSM